MRRLSPLRHLMKRPRRSLHWQKRNWRGPEWRPRRRRRRRRGWRRRRRRSPWRKEAEEEAAAAAVRAAEAEAARARAEATAAAEAAEAEAAMRKATQAQASAIAKSERRGGGAHAPAPAMPPTTPPAAAQAFSASQAEAAVQAAQAAAEAASAASNAVVGIVAKLEGGASPSDGGALSGPLLHLAGNQSSKSLENLNEVYRVELERRDKERRNGMRGRQHGAMRIVSLMRGLRGSGVMRRRERLHSRWRRAVRSCKGRSL